MNSRSCLKALCILLLSCACLPSLASTWYVRRDGGTRFSSGKPTGQCDGTADAPYPGSGVNKHCAFNDVRYLWSDGTYSYGKELPGWGWIGAGGDTYILRGSLASGVSYRVGWNSPTYCDPSGCWGITGDPFGSGAPPPPSGTASQHTRILGENYAACHTPSARTQLHGGWGAFTVLSLVGTSYVDMACLDITDFSACGRATQQRTCDASQDFAQTGLRLSNATNHVSLKDIRIHGMATNGIAGPTGDGVVMENIELLGNASSGWNADAGDRKTGKGSLSVRHFNISWNGCAEEYPLEHTLPYGDCTDDTHGGYGDGFGTATLSSEAPGWQVLFDDGVVSYNTQDGLDALHIDGPGSSMTVTHTQAYSNMGQQIKIGGAAAVVTDNVIIGNCRALGQQIPGTPAHFNAHLGDYCRAGDTAVLLDVQDGQPAVYARNIVYSANHVGVEVDYPGAPSPTAAIKFDYNIFVGFPDQDGDKPSPIYSVSDLKMFTHRGASFSHNVTFHPKDGWQCPATSLHEIAGRCGDPHLKDETWHPFGMIDTSRTTATDTSETFAPAEPPAQADSHAALAWKSAGAAVLVGGIVTGIRYRRSRTDEN